MPSQLSVTAITGTARLGGPERVLLDFANLAFEHDVALRVLSASDGPLVEILNNIGVPAEVVAAPRSLIRGTQHGRAVRSLPRALPGLLRWSRELRRHSFLREADVLLTTHFRSHFAVALTRRHPMVWHLHEFPPTRFWRWLVRQVPDAAITNSDTVRASWNDSASERVVRIHNGVNLDRFKPRERTGWVHTTLGIPQNHRIIGAPTILIPWKGHRTIISAFEQIRATHEDVHLAFVGGPIYDTDEENLYAALLTEKMRRADRVHLLPFQREIELAYSEFTLAVDYPMRPEPFGRVVVEAMACAVPIIASNEGGPSEIVGGGIGPRREAGWLVEPRSETELARVLESALALPDEVRQSIGLAGRRRAEDLFSARRFARELAEALRRVISDA